MREAKTAAEAALHARLRREAEEAAIQAHREGEAQALREAVGAQALGEAQREAASSGAVISSGSAAAPSAAAPSRRGRRWDVVAPGIQVSDGPGPELGHGPCVPSTCVVAAPSEGGEGPGPLPPVDIAAPSDGGGGPGPLPPVDIAAPSEGCEVVPREGDPVMGLMSTDVEMTPAMARINPPDPPPPASASDLPSDSIPPALTARSPDLFPQGQDNLPSTSPAAPDNSVKGASLEEGGEEDVIDEDEEESSDGDDSDYDGSEDSMEGGRHQKQQRSEAKGPAKGPAKGKRAARGARLTWDGARHSRATRGKRRKSGSDGDDASPEGDEELQPKGGASSQRGGSAPVGPLPPQPPASAVQGSLPSTMATHAAVPGIMLELIRALEDKDLEQVKQHQIENSGPTFLHRPFLGDEDSWVEYKDAMKDLKSEPMWTKVSRQQAYVVSPSPNDVPVSSEGSITHIISKSL